MSDIPVSMQRRARRRARERCEYCLLEQAGQEATFHIDHVRPRSDGGTTVLDNLALACVSCSLRKGARTNAIDPASGQLERLFNPRVDRWADHFTIEVGFRLDGRTPTGRATVRLLDMNRPLALAIRTEEASRGRFRNPADE